MRKSRFHLHLGAKMVLRMRKSAYLTYCLFCEVIFQSTAGDFSFRLPNRCKVEQIMTNRFTFRC